MEAGDTLADLVVHHTLVLDRHLQRLGKSHGVFDVPTVHGDPVADVVTIEQGHTVEGPIEQPESPGVTEVIFGARAAQARLFFAIDVEAVVALAEPALRARLSRKHRAHVMSASFGIEDQIVPAHLGGIFLAVLSVEVRGIIRQTRDLIVVDVEIDRSHPVLLRVVRQGDYGSVSKWHGPIAVVGATLRRHRYGQRVDVTARTVPDGKEVAQR